MSTNTPPVFAEPIQHYIEATDANLMESSRSGDRQAYAELWSRYQRYALIIARRTTDRYDPEDIVAETSVRILSAFASGRGPQQNFGGYVASTIRSVSMLWAKRHDSEILSNEPEAYRTLSDGQVDSPEQLLELKLGVRTAFAQLPDRWKTVLWLTAVEGHAVASVAETFGESPAVVSALALRARKGLRRALESDQMTLEQASSAGNG